MITAIALSLLFGWRQAAHKSAQPRVSTTGTSYLSCTAWTGNGWTDPTPRSSRTPFLESPKGFRAYAEVKTIVNNGDCKNTTTLYVASGVGQTFRIVYTKTPSSSDGNGIRLIGWSPSGDKLLAEVNLWRYETDGGFDHLAYVYDASRGVAKELHPDRALARHFGSSCEFELAVDDWKTDEQISIKVSKSPESETYVQHFCVNKPRKFLFDLQEETLGAEPPERRKDN